MEHDLEKKKRGKILGVATSPLPIQNPWKKATT
jgi:hypothetical protein